VGRSSCSPYGCLGISDDAGATHDPDADRVAGKRERAPRQGSHDEAPGTSLADKLMVAGFPGIDQRTGDREAVNAAFPPDRRVRWSSCPRIRCLWDGHDQAACEAAFAQNPLSPGLRQITHDAGCAVDRERMDGAIDDAQLHPRFSRTTEIGSFTRHAAPHSEPPRRAQDETTPRPCRRLATYRRRYSPHAPRPAIRRPAAARLPTEHRDR